MTVSNVTPFNVITSPSPSPTLPSANLTPASLTAPAVTPDFRHRLEAGYHQQKLQTFVRGQIIPLKERELWVVARGVVLLNTLYPSGDEALIGIAGASLPFGLPLSLVQPYQAIAFSTVDAMSLTMAEIESSPILLQAFNHSLVRRLQQAEMMVALLGQRRVEERLKQFLQLLASEVGQPTPTGTRLGLRLTHQHLANALGTTRVTVTRLLNQLRDDHWLSLDQGRHIVISSGSLPDWFSSACSTRSVG